jgi:O-antigen ligase
MATRRNELGVYPSSFEVATSETTSYPPAFLEYMWYVSLAYAMLGQAWGVVIPSVGGALLAIIAAACFLSVGAQIRRVYAPVAFAFFTGFSVVAVQFFLHDEQALDHCMPFVGWLLTLIIVQALALSPGFLHRFALAALMIGLGVLPYAQARPADGGLIRVAASGTGISNPNALAMWFGFCTVYFIFLGLQSRKPMLRAVTWTVAFVSLFIVALTVSRGPLLGIALACVVGLRWALKRQLAPVLLLILLLWVVYASGAFQETIDYYLARGTEESGRGKVWPVALQRFLDSLWTGVGLEAIPTKGPSGSGKAITPHNGLLYIGLGAGIIPLLCFLGYFLRTGIGIRWIMRRVHTGEAALLPPLVTFALVEVMSLDLAFMSPWVVVVFGLAARCQRLEWKSSTSEE